MKITLLGHYDIASLYALDRLIGLLPDHTFTVLLSGNATPKAPPVPALESLAEQDESLCEQFLAGAIKGPVASQLSAEDRGTLEKPNTPEGHKALSDTKPELVVSIRHRNILREDAIAIPRLGILNLHSGILPDYRGVMATFWAMLDGAKEIGTTLHWIVDSGIDTGPVVEIRKQPVLATNSYLANVLGLYADGCESIASAVHAIAAGNAVPVQSQTSGGQYFSVPEAEDIRRFESQGMTLFDGNEAAFI